MTRYSSGPTTKLNQSSGPRLESGPGLLSLALLLQSGDSRVTQMISRVAIAMTCLSFSNGCPAKAGMQAGTTPSRPGRARIRIQSMIRFDTKGEEKEIKAGISREFDSQLNLLISH